MDNILFNYLPYTYEQSLEVKAIQQSIETEKNVLDSKMNDLYNQISVSKATWSLYMWENMLGIKNVSNDYTVRRENILARLRSKGTSSKKALEKLCNSFSGGNVKIIEDYANFSFMVKFISEESIPSNLEGLTNALNEVVPAHISWDYLFVYNIWLQCKEQTWELGTQTWGDDKTADFIQTDMIAMCSNNTLCNNILLCGTGV